MRRFHLSTSKHIVDSENLVYVFPDAYKNIQNELELFLLDLIS